MSNKTNLIIGVLVVVAVIGLVVIQSSGKKAAPTTPLPQNQQTIQQVQSSDAVQQSGSTTTASQIDNEIVKSYTLSEVAAHATASDCWTVVNNNVYDVTSWVNKHPGGAQAIIGLCGVDGSAAFSEQHGGDKRPASELAKFKIGVLAR